jgi:hypothetical protein
VEFDVATLRSEIQTMYGRVATAPDSEFHFHRGPAYAASRLGYDHAELAQLPVAVTSSFAGVGNPHAIAPIEVSAVVLDIGSGAGTDLLLAARRVGPKGRAIGVDMTAACVIERWRVPLRPGSRTLKSLMAMRRASGFTNVRVLDRFDCFAGTTKERTAKRYGVIGVNLTATRS